MAFTEKTFSLLRESVKQSMAEDKENNLPTGEVIAHIPTQSDANINVAYEIDAVLSRLVTTSYLSETLTIDEVKSYIADKGQLSFIYKAVFEYRRFLQEWSANDSNDIVDILLTYIPKNVLISLYTFDGPVYDEFGEGCWGIRHVTSPVYFRPFKDITYDGKNVIVDVRIFDEKQQKVKIKKGMKLGKALRELIPDFEDEHIKRIVNGFVAKLAPRYICFTKSHIHTHYRVLAVKQDLTSCMSKPASFYRNPRPGVDVDPDESPEIYYIHPCEAYNDSPNLRLALISPYHPDSEEYNKPDQYPFIARAICRIDDDGDICFARAYGLESAQDVFKAGLNRSDTNGGLLNKIESTYGDHIMPYVDCHNSFNDDGDYFVIDEYGDYEIDHAEGVAQTKRRCYCAHCDEYHDDCDEYDGIWVNALDGYVYGSCQENYVRLVGRSDYYHVDDCQWSDTYGGYIYNDDAIEFINEVVSHRWGCVETDYIDADDADCQDVAALEEPYKGYEYARKDLCTYVEDHGWYINEHEGEYFVLTIDDKPMLLDDVVYSDYYDGYISSDEAVQNSEGDWVLEDDLEEEKNNEQSVEAA